MKHSIPENTLEEIYKCIPIINDDVKTLFYRDFEFNFHDLKNGGNLGVSLVCLRDAYFRLNSAKESLYNAYIQNIWYEKYEPDAQSKIESIIFSKYYLDYIPLLLYAVQEDVADFIINFLDKSAQFQAWKKLSTTEELFEEKRVISNAGKTGLYMKEKHSDSQLSNVIFKLVANKSWKKAIKYRNSWVHEKPPIVEGLGIQHSRESRIKIKDGKRTFGFGGSSKPDYTIGDLFDIARRSTEAGVVLINELITIVDNKSDEIKHEINFFNKRIELTTRAEPNRSEFKGRTLFVSVA